MAYRTLLALGALMLSSWANADMKMYEDYELSKSVVSMTTVKVDTGKGEDYLEGLKQTWVESNEVAKKLGHISDYGIYVSILPESGDFNVVLIVNLGELADYAPSKKKYDAFMKQWSEKKVKQSEAIAETYPELREIVGEYLLNAVEFK